MWRSHVALLLDMDLISSLTRRMSISKNTGPDANETLRGVDLTRPLYHSRVFKQFRNENGFNKRYFVLYPGFILYYKHERDYHNHLKGGMVGLSRVHVLPYTLHVFMHTNVVKKDEPSVELYIIIRDDVLLV